MKIEHVLGVLFLVLALTSACGGDDDDEGDMDSSDMDAAAAVTVMEVSCTGITPDHQVDIDNISFNPSALTVASGDVVQWTNMDGNIDHTVTSGAAGAGSGEDFDSGILNNGESYCLSFENTGSVPYHCDVHQGMTGTVTVE